MSKSKVDNHINRFWWVYFIVVPAALVLAYVQFGHFIGCRHKGCRTQSALTDVYKALEDYRADQPTGADCYPDNLNDLIGTKYLKRLPKIPYFGKKLRVGEGGVTRKEWVIYYKAGRSSYGRIIGFELTLNGRNISKYQKE